MRRSEERKKQKRKKLAVVLAVCLAGFCASGYMVISQLVREKRDEAAFTALIAQIRPEDPEDSADTSADTSPDTSANRHPTAPGEIDIVPPADEPLQPDPGFHRYDDQSREIGGITGKFYGTNLTLCGNTNKENGTICIKTGKQNAYDYYIRRNNRK